MLSLCEKCPNTPYLNTFDVISVLRDLFPIAELIFSNIFFFLKSEWSQLAPEIKTSESTVFKNETSLFYKTLTRYLTRLRLYFKHLHELKFRHGFLDTLNLLRCLNFKNTSRSLFMDISSINSSFKTYPVI